MLCLRSISDSLPQGTLPAEYMASVLSNNMNDIKQVTFFMEECQRMGVPVLGPDVNESNYKFTVNQKEKYDSEWVRSKGLVKPL